TVDALRVLGPPVERDPQQANGEPGMSVTTKELYDDSSNDWQRSDPILLSDFTARPFLLKWCDPVAGLNVLDLGCGEGYFARGLKRKGAGSILGIDVSDEMVRGAQQRESQ